jgi:hypothetical protein
MRRRDGERGAALLLVILLVALLAVMVVEFQREAWVQRRSAENLRSDLQAHAVLRSGSELAVNAFSIYTKNRFSDIRTALAVMKDLQIFWDLFFGNDWVTVPVPAGADEPLIPVKALLLDLYGKFPIGALADPQTSAAREKEFEYFLESVREFAVSREEYALENLVASEVAREIAELVKDAGARNALSDLSQLQEVEGLTPQVLGALRPYLDTRTEWQFCVNGLSVPMIMTMAQKSVDEARQIKAELSETPLDDAGQIPSSPLGTRTPIYPQQALLLKTLGFELFLEADVGGVLRRARAIYRLGAQPPAGSPAGGSTPKFQLKGWAEGWVEGWPATTEPETREVEIR